ncbi:predicted protein [Sclerotinia sclerotiorum 1980 UF-70]|uniref:Uncharacterized protein n=1 Tax=Sclerotinia sclerotiorum (strain ATCC 18683 / 1980 / Ss-1) TaxID=665079 RepID=A7EX93_SCLS1|nr:predicted protein [Sclerotinia sclerotiorum 1980 UF-70]EDN94085.1 predicted protein [Sclerotinia sclerotiorum 1980 UF-70]
MAVKNSIFLEKFTNQQQPVASSLCIWHHGEHDDLFFQPSINSFIYYQSATKHVTPAGTCDTVFIYSWNIPDTDYLLHLITTFFIYLA